MYMIKSGSMYLTENGDWTAHQPNAMRLDKPMGSTNNSPRFVKLRPAHDTYLQDVADQVGTERDAITITGRDLLVQD